jgi:hypothetical protein
LWHYFLQNFRLWRKLGRPKLVLTSLMACFHKSPGNDSQHQMFRLKISS